MKLEVRLFGKVLGFLSDDTTNGVAVFEFSTEYKGATPSPFMLEKRAGLVSPGNPIKGLHGCFSDSLPDYFGDGAMDQWFRQNGINPEKVSSLVRLSYVGDRGWGALEYLPDQGAAEKDFIRALDEIYLERCSRAVKKGNWEDIPQEFLKAASSLGGARPKLTIGISHKDPNEIVVGNWRLCPEYAPWILKVDVSPEKQYGKIEHAYLAMARKAGIHTSPSKVLELMEEGIKHHHFAVQRYDRLIGGEKVHCHTLAGLLERDFNKNQTSYKELLIVCKRLTGDIQLSKEFLRRGIFNYLSRNCDDHAKNHSFTMDRQGKWAASPAYDLTPSGGEGNRGVHAMMVDEGVGTVPTLKDWIKVADLIGIKKGEVTEIFNQVKEAIASWDDIAQDCEITKVRRKEIKELFPEEVKIRSYGRTESKAATVLKRPKER